MTCKVFFSNRHTANSMQVPQQLTKPTKPSIFFNPKTFKCTEQHVHQLTMPLLCS